MKMNTRSARRTTRVAAALTSSALALATLGCASTSSNPQAALTAAQAKNAGNFTTTVFLGDSLTAGYQSGSLLDTQQVNGWPVLVAKQAGFKVVQPLIAYPGAPNVMQLVSVLNPAGPGIITVTGSTTGRDDFSVQVTDLAVPGATLNDIANTVPIVSPTTAQQQINQLVLGYPGLGYGQAYSQATFAIKANPTTIFLWAGNNDALIADLTGTPTTMTPVANFTTQYQALITQLTTQTSAHLVIANIPDVTAVPYLQPAAGLLAKYSAGTGLPTTTLSALFGISAGDYVTPAGLSQLSAIIAGTQKTPLSDAGVLTAAEVVTAKANVVAYNQVIAQQATAAGATLVDINALFAQVATSGVTINGVTGTSAFLGGVFSLDGVHPTNTGYAVIANKFIDTMNAAIKTSIADVNVTTVAAADPLWPTNLLKTTGGKDITLTPEATNESNKTLIGNQPQQ